MANGFDTDLWTLERVAVVITQLTGVRYHPGHVWVILRRRLGWTLQRPERRASERDEEAITRWVQQEWPRIKKRALLSHPWVGQARPGSGGHSPPRASMARPISASGDLNPNAIRVSRRSLVLTDSTRALEAPCRRLATIVSR
jgi:hypothetical protein